MIITTVIATILGILALIPGTIYILTTSKDRKNQKRFNKMVERKGGYIGLRLYTLPHFINSNGNSQSGTLSLKDKEFKHWIEKEHGLLWLYTPDKPRSYYIT